MYKRKDKELLSLISHLQVILDGCNLEQAEIDETAMKILELSQTLRSKWIAADIAEKRALLEILCSNLTFKSVSLAITMRKPFDTLAEGLQMKFGTGKPMQIERFWADVCEYPTHLLPLFVKLRL